MAAIERVLVTGGAGFIGSAVVRHLVGAGYYVINVDKLTYAGHLESLRSIQHSPNYSFYQCDICDQPTVSEILTREQPDAILHLAAETHVDRSIDSAGDFIETNVVGTFRLLNATLDYWRSMAQDQQRRFRFHHVSTDEVFGALPLEHGTFDENSRYEPSSPYSASKASADHFARAWHMTYGLPVVLSNCSNNYGPFHFPEKLIPLTILNALEGKSIAIYSRGENVRDWLYVEDHARALEQVLRRGTVGASYNIGGRSERTNLGVVESICDILDRKRPREPSHRELISFVADRPGHDLRYALDTGKIERELGWSPHETFESGLEKTVDWFLENEWWWRPIRERDYSGERLGIGR